MYNKVRRTKQLEIEFEINLIRYALQIYRCNLQIFEFQHSEADGLRILAFPCNQFGSQEPGTNEEIKAFAAAKGVEFGKGFVFFAKIDVIGDNAHPLWKYLKTQQGIEIEWNFAKFVIDKQGIPCARFGTTEDPIPKVLEKCMSLFQKKKESQIEPLVDVVQQFTGPYK